MDPTCPAGDGESMDEMHDGVIAAAKEVLTGREPPDRGRGVARLADQGRGDVGIGGRRDRHVAMPSRPGVGSRIGESPKGPVLLGFNETRRNDSTWRGRVVRPPDDPGGQTI